jgi:hypothetical protein
MSKVNGLWQDWFESLTEAEQEKYLDEHDDKGQEEQPK